MVLASQIQWSVSVEQVFANNRPLSEELRKTEAILRVLADYVLQDLQPILRKKCEQLTTELVHQRDVLRELIKESVKSATDFAWLSEMRFYLAEESVRTF